MDVAINTRFLLPQLEGIGTFTFEICKRLVHQNPDVRFHFLFDRRFDDKYVFAKNVIPHVVSPPARHPWLWYLWYEWAVPKVLSKIKADVFFSPDNFCSLKTKVPTLMVTHDLAFEHFPEHIRRSHLQFFKKYSKKYHERADKIACVSEFTRQDVTHQYGIKQEKTLVTYNGCSDKISKISDDEKSRIKSKYSEGKDYLLYIGAIHPRKNILNLIKAFEIFKGRSGSDIKLILSGRMAWKTAEIEGALESSLARKDIIYLGYVDEVNDLLSAARALCYPSLFEGFGIPILEAFRTGVPVMTSDVSSMPEVAGDASLLVDPLNVMDIAEGINTIVNDAALRNQLITKGNIRAKDFSWDASAEAIMNALKEIAR